MFFTVILEGIEIPAKMNGLIKRRTVTVPDEKIKPEMSSFELAELIYQYGQNCIENMPKMRSVSVGDTIILLNQAKKIKVEPIGFSELPWQKDTDGEQWLNFARNRLAQNK